MRKYLPGITTAWAPVFTYSILFTLLVISRNQQFWNQRKASAALVELVPRADLRQSVFTDLYKTSLGQELALLKFSYSYPDNKNPEDIKKAISEIDREDSLFTASAKLVETKKEHQLFAQLKTVTATKKRYLDQFFQQINSGRYGSLRKEYENDLAPVYDEYQQLSSQLLYAINSNDQKLIKDAGLKIIHINNINVWISLGLIFLLISIGVNFIMIGKKSRRTTLALKESERKYRTLTEQTNEIIEKCDAEGRFVFANESFRKTFEYNEEELSHLTISDLLNEDAIFFDLPPEKQNVIANVEKVCKSKSGKRIYLEGTIFLEYSKGIFKGSMGFFNDVTEKKKLEESLVASELKFRNFFKLAPVPIWVVDPQNNEFLSVNNAACEHYGYSESEFLNMTISDIRQVVDLAKESEEVQRVKDETLSLSQNKTRKYKFCHLKKGGAKIETEVYTSPIFINDRKCILSISLDVTERNQIENKITKAIIKTQEDERYEIGSELHDNVCQILAAAKMSLGMIKPSLMPCAMESYNKSSEAILLATKEIRNLSHRLAPAFFDNTKLDVAFESLLKTFNIDEKYHVAIKFDKNALEMCVKQDLQLNLYRILQEQLRNILEHAHCTDIEISVFICTDNLHMRIADNGIGFDVNEVTYGIGIANMKRRAELFSGQLYVNSSKGKGCELMIIIPLEKAI
ncbi:MAG: PAS domain S-box protein [Ginsengibacter sp.]